MKPLRGATALVTGAAGHLGASLTRALLDAGCAVRALVYDGDQGVRGLPVARVTGDVCDPAAVRAAVAGVDVVFHLAARISIEGDPDGRVRRTNVEGTRVVAEACLDARAPRLVHFSSVHAFAPPPRAAGLDERALPSDIDPRAPAYDRSKAAGERVVSACVARGLDAVIVNPTGVIGPYDHGPSKMGATLLRMTRGEAPVIVEGGFDWVDARDVARSALAAAERGRRGERYLLGGHWRSLVELAAMLAALQGRRAAHRCAPMWAARLGAPAVEGWARLRGTEPLYTREALHALRRYGRVDDTKARRELGHRPRALEETLADTMAWFREAAGRAEVGAPSAPPRREPKLPPPQIA